MSFTEEGDTPSRLQGKKVAVFICWLLGMGSLLSWNSMLTIGDYYYKIFPDYHPSRVLTLVYQPFAVGTLAILAYHESKIDTRWRNIAGYILFFISTLGCLLLDVATSGKGGVGYYVGLCILVAAFGVADAHVQGGMCGDLAFMLPEFIQSFFAGLAASGALTSGLRLVTKAAFDKSDDGLRKVLFLAIATGVEFLCIFLYSFYFPKLPIVKYFRSKAASEGSKTLEDSTKPVEDRFTLKQLLHQNWDFFLDLYLIYVLTLSIFPGFLYENTGNHGLGEWYAIVLIAMYNLESRKGLMTAILARFLFVPAFYFTAKYADEGWMIMLTSLLGFTNGHLTVCVMTAAPKGTGAKCIGKFAGFVPSRRHIYRCLPRLVVDHRQRKLLMEIKEQVMVYAQHTHPGGEG
ncbi:Equilibrative nucleotide transporter 3 [Bienertia sinuspersici]